MSKNDRLFCSIMKGDGDVNIFWLLQNSRKYLPDANAAKAAKFFYGPPSEYVHSNSAPPWPNIIIIYTLAIVRNTFLKYQ